jgi:glutamine synthetase
MWMARYILQRVSEYYNVIINFSPKPVLGDWNGSGCHMNFSTNETRNDINLKVINEHMEKLKTSHTKLVKLYGENNEFRLTGKNKY